MAKLSVTLIDVGWGDSIFIEAEDSAGKPHYALIDSNDTDYLRLTYATYTFLDKFFKRKGYKANRKKPYFDFIMLSHAHGDHGDGLKRIIDKYHTKAFYYPKSLDFSPSAAVLLKYCKDNVGKTLGKYHSLYTDDEIPHLGDKVKAKVLWPDEDHINEVKERFIAKKKVYENDNSIVLSLTLDSHSIVLTGDAEKKTWRKAADRIPSDTVFFKVPHHGSVNGTFSGKKSPWIEYCTNAVLGISCHVWKNFKHPGTKVLKLFDKKKLDYYRTDEQYHITFETDGKKSRIKYSGFEEL